MDYNVQSNIKKTVFSDIKEITNTNVDWNRFNGKTVLNNRCRRIYRLLSCSHISRKK